MTGDTEAEFNGTKGTVHYIWTNDSAYSTTGKVFFVTGGIFLKEIDDETWAKYPGVFIPYSRMVGIEFEE